MKENYATIGGAIGLALPSAYQMGLGEEVMTQGGAIAIIVSTIAGFLIGYSIKKS